MVAEAVAGLRASAGARFDDPRMVELVDHLSVSSEHFARLWARHDVLPKVGGTRRIRHPLVGPMELRHEKLAVSGSAGQLLVIHHAEPGTPSPSFARFELPSPVSTGRLSGHRRATGGGTGAPSERSQSRSALAASTAYGATPVSSGPRCVTSRLVVVLEVAAPDPVQQRRGGGEQGGGRTLLGALASLDRGSQTTGVALQVGRDRAGHDGVGGDAVGGPAFVAPTANSVEALLDWP